MNNKVLNSLLTENDSKLVLLVADGLGGLAIKPGGKTELESAHTPNLDKLAETSSCGLLDPISPGITPGSGPAHLSLFGYDPIEFNIGRGVLAALGINFDLKKGDLCARINFATVNNDGLITDRRAGRIPTETNEKLCKLLSDKIQISQEYELFIKTVKEHRAVIIVRGKDLNENIADTDPQQTGLRPLDPKPSKSEAEKTARLFKDIISQARTLLKQESKANMILLRGFAQFHPYPTMQDRFKLKSLAIAGYPMYRGLAKLVGMDTLPPIKNLEQGIQKLRENLEKYDFFYLHVKKTDSYGEDGNFKDKVKKIEYIDTLIPKIFELNPDVFAITGDHSTPAKLKSHSWHPIPVLLYSKQCRQDKLKEFSEHSCIRGSISRQPSTNLLPLMLANALRLKKYGA